MLNSLKFLILLFCFSNVFASTGTVILPNISFDVTDKESLQRGANVYMENCVGCHSLKYVRYKSLAEGIGIINKDTKEVLNDFIQKNWTFNIVNINNSVLSNLTQDAAVKWFGKTPPDLSLITRYRGSNWVYMYMKSFYYDNTKVWNVNNQVFPDVGMPHVLLDKQGLQNAIYDNHGNIINLTLVEAGTMSVDGYDSLVYDLVNFLTYVGEPIKALRIKLGMFVIPFLIVFTYFAYCLKKEYWKDIK